MWECCNNVVGCCGDSRDVAVLLLDNEHDRDLNSREVDGDRDDIIDFRIRGRAAAEDNMIGGGVQLFVD